MPETIDTQLGSTAAATAAAASANTPPTTATVPAAAAAAQKQKAVKPKAKAKAKRRKVFKLRFFDKVLLNALHEGDTNAMEIARRLNVDVNEFERRLTTLVNHKLVARDTSNPSLIHLTVKGFEAYLPKPKATRKVEEKVEEVEAKAEVKELPAVPKIPRENLLEKTAAEKTVVGVPAAAPTTATKSLEPSFFEKRQQEKTAHEAPAAAPVVKTEVLDLLEQQRQSRKRPPTPHFRPLTTALTTQEPASESAGVSAAVSNGKCELCKKPFKLSVASASEAKYGHCFCGAAYHKDCYESLLSNNSKCVQCSKKLRLILDKSSEEAVKTVKELF